jgi:hypothetical protein
MNRMSRCLAVLAGGLVAGAALLTPAAAAEPSGPWAPFNHCPVDDPALMNAPPSTFGAACVSSVAQTGSFTIGTTKVTTKLTELQLGATGTATDNSTVIVPAADGKTLVSGTVTVPGGLLGLELPEDEAGLGAILNRLLSGPPLGVQATVELAGLPSDFDGSAALGSGGSIVTLPVRVHLQNAILGSRCYIGSAKDPILLKPMLQTAPENISTALFSGGFIVGLTATLGDDTFTVPEAKGCGPLNLLDKVINAKLGLPSASGANHLVLSDARLSVALTQQGGQALHDAWHAAASQ